MSEDFLDDENIDYGNDIVAVTDEDGTEHQFEELASFAEDDNEYVALLPIPDEDEDVADVEEEGELIILRRTYEGEDIYLEPIEDEDEFYRIGKKFEEMLADEFDFND